MEIVAQRETCGGDEQAAKNIACWRARHSIRSQRSELQSAASMNADTGAGVDAVDAIVHNFLQTRVSLFKISIAQSFAPVTSCKKPAIYVIEIITNNKNFQGCSTLHHLV